MTILDKVRAWLPLPAQNSSGHLPSVAGENFPVELQELS